MKRRTHKRRNPLAAAVRRMKPKRIPSARDYRRQAKQLAKHRKPLRDMQSEAVFVCAQRMAAIRDCRFFRIAGCVKAATFATNGNR